MNMLDHLIIKQTRLFQIIFLMLTTLVLTACGAKQPSPNLYNRMVSHNEFMTGKMKLDQLIPSSKIKGEITQGSLGRSITVNDEGQHNLDAPPPCAKLLPDRVRDNYRDRLTEVFDDYVLSTVKPSQSQVNFKKIDYSLDLPSSASAGSIISAKVGIARILGYVSERELKNFDRCCQLTGSCGKHMINNLYELDQDIQVINKAQPSLQKDLMAFEAKNKADLKTVSLKGLAQKVYNTQAKLKKQRLTQGVSHVDIRKIPKGLPSPFGKAKLIVEPMVSKIKCKPKKSKSANVVEFQIKLENVEGAQETLGYEIQTSKQWVDLSLAERKRGVKVGTGAIACYPGPDAFTSPDDRCPQTLVLNAFPPPCDSMKGEGNFSWQAKFGVYGPGDDENRVHHLSKSNVTITKVHKR